MSDACDHTPTRRAVIAEREFLALLGGGCTAPVAAHARFQNDALTLEGLAATIDGVQVLRAEQTAEADETMLPRLVYDALLAQGAGPLLTAA